MTIRNHYATDVSLGGHKRANQSRGEYLVWFKTADKKCLYQQQHEADGAAPDDDWVPGIPDSSGIDERSLSGNASFTASCLQLCSFSI